MADLNIDSIFSWALLHKAEIAGTFFGLVYIWFSIRQSLHTWTAGIVTSLLYCWVFFDAKIYAGMGLQIYYVGISIYGWLSWHKMGDQSSGENQLKVTVTEWTLWLKLITAITLVSFFMYFILDRYTDSPVPLWDSLTTSLSVFATWMLARKKIEHWLIWIFVDLVSVVMYLHRGLNSTVILFFVYALMAAIGYYEWRKDLKKLI